MKKMYGIIHRIENMSSLINKAIWKSNAIRNFNFFTFFYLVHGAIAIWKANKWFAVNNVKERKRETKKKCIGHSVFTGIWLSDKSKTQPMEIGWNKWIVAN